MEGGPGCLLGRGGQGVRGAPSLREARGALAALRGLQWGKEESREGRARQPTLLIENRP